MGCCFLRWYGLNLWIFTCRCRPRWIGISSQDYRLLLLMMQQSYKNFIKVKAQLWVDFWKRFIWEYQKLLLLEYMRFAKRPLQTSANVKWTVFLCIVKAQELDSIKIALFQILYFYSKRCRSLLQKAVQWSKVIYLYLKRSKQTWNFLMFRFVAFLIFLSIWLPYPHQQLILD